MTNETKFERELAKLINAHSLENDSDTPDFILAKYLVGCLQTWNTTQQLRIKYYYSDR